MTDVKAKSPKKRKSLPNQQNQPQSVKKIKAESNTDSPKNGVAPKTPKKESPEKLKKFKGTGDLIKSEQPSPKKNEPKKKAKAQLGQPRRARLVEQIKGGNKQVEAELNKKIKLLESLPEKTKTAKRKLAFLKKVKGEVEGNLPKQPVKGEGKNKNKTTSQKRRQRKKKSTTGAEDKNETAESNEQKSVVKKENAGAIQQKKNQPKKANSPVKKEQQLVKKEKAPKQAKGDKKPVKQEVAQVENKKNKGKKAVVKQEKVEDEPEDESVEEDNVEEEDSEEEGGDVSEEEDEDDEVESKNTKSEVQMKKQPQPKSSNKKELSNESKKQSELKIEDLQKNDILKKNQKRYVVFVGNIPYDATTQDLKEHFSKVGDVRHVRIPTDKKTNKPRGFAYVEVDNDDAYQRCLSMHHSTMKGRRINVLYTEGGKKKGEEQKKKIKAKNFKLHAMRKQGQLAGSKKDTQKRSFRRAKQNNMKQSQQDE